MVTSPIPKIIHLTSATRNPPGEYSFFLNRIKLLHPDWEISIWDDNDALSLVNRHFPEFSDMYVSYPVPIQRADIFRVLVVYLLGGFYLDMDMLLFRNLDILCRNQLVLGIEKTLPLQECFQLDHLHRIRIANYMFGSRPGHPFWKDLLYAARKMAGKAISAELDILESTGPGLLTDLYHEVKDKYEDITLIANERNACLRSCGPASCNFGDFAAHLHMGSWRWENR